MVARIKEIKNMTRALGYNEEKIERQVAQLIDANSFAKDAAKLSIKDKLGTLQKYMERNTTSAVKGVHISLNFHPSDEVNDEKLKEIARIYMDRIGFADQPYLVYQHFDAAHPHVHILSTNIKRDGKRISLSNVGRGTSKQARQELEQKFGLTPSNKKQGLTLGLEPVSLERALYGKRETKMAMHVVLSNIIPTYRYTSLAELNAVLKNYNVIADPGAKGSRINKTKGLVYRLLNERGEKVGVPIKASDFATKPTLMTLSKHFADSEAFRKDKVRRVRTAVDFALKKPDINTLEKLHFALKMDGIQLVSWTNKSGITYGLTFIDHRSKCVFNGSDLGKAYTANTLQQRLKDKADIKRPSMAPTDELSATHKPIPKPTTQYNERQTVVTQPFPPLVGDHVEQETVSDDSYKKKKRKKLRH